MLVLQLSLLFLCRSTALLVNKRSTKFGSVLRPDGQFIPLLSPNMYSGQSQQSLSSLKLVYSKQTIFGLTQPYIFPNDISIANGFHLSKLVG